MTLDDCNEGIEEQTQQCAAKDMDTPDPVCTKGDEHPAHEDCHQYYETAAKQCDDYCQPTSSKVLVENLVTDKVDDEHYWEFHMHADCADDPEITREKR